MADGVYAGGPRSTRVDWRDNWGTAGSVSSGRALPSVTGSTNAYVHATVADNCTLTDGARTARSSGISGVLLIRQQQSSSMGAREQHESVAAAGACVTHTHCPAVPAMTL
ncbi:MAG TPA: hypothetical protein DGT21_09950 [Armatimonadetes bacterium]|nr:hypothetical protein [Armatimonadota bacterium]